MADGLIAPPELPTAQARDECANWLVRAATVLATVVCAVMSSIVVLLSLLGGTVVVIWLAVLRDWGTIGIGLIAGIVMPLGYSLASLPAMGLGLIAAALWQSRAKLLSLPFGLLTMLWNCALVAVWVIMVFAFAVGSARGHSAVPYLLWAYTTTMAPLSYMASKEPSDSHATSMALLYAVICYVIEVLWFLIGGPFRPWLYAIAAFALAFAVLGVAMMLSGMAAESRAARAWHSTTS